MANQKVNYQITGENLLSKVLRQIDVDANKAEKSVNSVSKGGSRGGSGGIMGSVLSANLLTNAIQRGATAVVGFGKEVIDSLNEKETTDN